MAQEHAATVVVIQKRLRGILAHVGIQRHRIGAEALERLAGVLLRGAADVAALGVQDHRHIRVFRIDMRNQALQCSFAMVVRGEIRNLRFERTGVLRGGIDNVATKREKRVVVIHKAIREFGRIRVKAHADQGVGLLPTGAQFLDKGHGGLLLHAKTPTLPWASGHYFSALNRKRFGPASSPMRRRLSSSYSR